MVVKPRPLFVVASTLTLLLSAAAPVMGVFEEAEPSPLRQENLLRVRDIAANGSTSSGAIVAVGWREASQPARLWLAFSLDGGRSYLRTNGKLRRYPIVGDGKLGMSLAICAGRVWVASAAQYPGDADGDTDVLITSRTIGGGAAQAFVTSPAGRHRVRDASIACIGNRFLAIGWLQKTPSKRTAKLMLRSLEPLGETPSFQQVYGLGRANFKGGISVAATPDAAFAAWSRGTSEHLRYKRFGVGPGETPDIVKDAAFTLAYGDAKLPQLAARGQKIVAAYADAGKIKAKISTDGGVSFGSVEKLVGAGSRSDPSKLHSVDVVGKRIVAEVSQNQQGTMTPQRVESTNLGGSWATRSFGHDGARVGAIMKRPDKPSLLREAWHHNAAVDTLRAQFERR